MIWREARRDDVPAVLALLAEDAMGSGLSPAGLDAGLAVFDAMQAEMGNRLIVAEAGGRIIACYHLTMISGLSLSAARRAQVEGVRVACDLRGRGIGAALFADAEARARAGGCTLIQLTSNAAREDAARFYRRVGFTPSHIGFKKPL